MPAPAARIRSASVPCGTISSSIRPAVYSASNTTEPAERGKEQIICRTRPSSISRASPACPVPALLATQTRSVAPCSISPSIRAFGCPTEPKPPISTTEPSATPSSASAIVRTRLSITSHARVDHVDTQVDHVDTPSAGRHLDHRIHGIGALRQRDHGFRSTDRSRGPADAANTDRRDSMPASAAMSAGGRPRAPSRIGAPRMERIMRSATSRAERAAVQRHVPQDLHEDAAQAEQRDRAEHRVLLDAHDALDAAAQLLGDQHALDAAAPAPRARVHQGGEALAHRGGVGDAQQHAADLRLVDDVRRQDLHHHRIAERAAAATRLRLRGAGGLGRAGDAGARQQRLASASWASSAGRSAAATGRGGAGRRRPRRSGPWRGSPPPPGSGPRTRRSRPPRTPRPGRAGDDGQDVEPVRMPGPHRAQLLAQPGRDGGRAADLGEEGQHGGVAAVLHHAVREAADQRHVVERLRGAVHRVARGGEGQQRLQPRLRRVRHRRQRQARASAASEISTPAPPLMVITPSVLRAG